MKVRLSNIIVMLCITGMPKPNTIWDVAITTV